MLPGGTLRSSKTSAELQEKGRTAPDPRAGPVSEHRGSGRTARLEEGGGGGAGAGVARGAAAAAAAGRRRRHTDAYCLRPLRATRFLPAGGTRARLPEARRRRPAAKAPRPPPRPLPGGAASKVAALRRTRQGEAGGEAARGSPPPGRAALLPPPPAAPGPFPARPAGEPGAARAAG